MYCLHTDEGKNLWALEGGDLLLFILQARIKKKNHWRGSCLYMVRADTVRENSSVFAKSHAKDIPVRQTSVHTHSATT